jgi:hypothetical protein
MADASADIELLPVLRVLPKTTVVRLKIGTDDLTGKNLVRLQK